MFFVSTAEDFANPLGELVSTEYPLGLYYLAFGVDPLGLYRIEPRALGWQQARHYPNPNAAGFDTAVVCDDPISHPVTLVPRSVVPDEKQSLLAPTLKLLAAPSEKLGGCGAHRAAVHEPKPGLCHLRQVKPVAGEGLRLGIVLRGLFLKESHRRLRGIRPRMQRRSLEAGEPALVLEAQSPPRMASGEPDQPISSPFFRAYSGSGLSIQRLARSQHTPSLASVARMVSPLTGLSVMPSSKLTSAAIRRVHRPLGLPYCLGSWWSISRKASDPLSSKAEWSSLGREEPALRAPRPLSLKAWMALRTVWEPHPRFSAIRGGRSRRELAKRIWQRLRTKASLERNPTSRASRSSFESVRTKIGGFMSATVTHRPLPVLQVH